MANSQALSTQFKTDLFNGIHAFGTTVARAGTTKDDFKAALYLASASLGAGTSTYSTTGELAGTGNYTQGGVAVTNGNAPANSGTTAYWTPSASFSWTALTSSGAFDAVQIYNDTQSDKTVGVWTFSSQNISAGDFALTMPTNNSSSALIRLA